MSTVTLIRKPLALTLATVLLAASVQTPVTAAMVDNQQLALQSELQIQRDEVRIFMARDDVRAAMQGYGVNAADLDARINNLSEGELLQIQNQLASMPAGGNGVLGAILAIILIFVLLDVLGATDVFPRI